MERVFCTNLFALLWVTRSGLEHPGSGGCIIYVSSIQAYEPSGTLPAAVAPALVFLASEQDASYISGTVLGVTGGRPVF